MHLVHLTSEESELMCTCCTNAAGTQIAEPGALLHPEHSRFTAHMLCRSFEHISEQEVPDRD